MEITRNAKNLKGGNVDAVMDEYNEMFKDGSADKTAERQSRFKFVVDNYYNLATSFYEWGWGQSFHFATRYPGEGFDASLARHEHTLALALGLSKGKKCLDMGCGVGGPMRSIARFSGASITGITINEYQVSRATIHTAAAGLSETCKVQQGDFNDLPFEANTFDAAYAIEATCHSPKLEDVYGQAFKVLKPGGLFAFYEWAMTDKYDPRNKDHAACKLGIEQGDGIPSLQTTARVLEAIKAVGFELVSAEDLASKGSKGRGKEIEWYEPLQGKFSINGFKHTGMGRACTGYLVWVLETLRLAPKGTCKVQSILQTAATHLVSGGVNDIFTPMYFVVARKPLNAK